MDNTKLDAYWNTITNRFKILKYKGQGSFGTVVSAKDLKTSKKVAIKLVSLEQDNFYSLKKLLREISIMRQLSQMEGSELITRLLEVILPEDTPLEKATHLFMVMDLMDSDLGRMMKNSRKLDFDNTHLLDILYQCLCSLHFLHSAGLMHRDVKPHNILVDSECNVKLCDFGLARSSVFEHRPLGDGERRSKRAKAQVKERELRAKNKRRLSNHVSSRWYRAPEVILLEKEYDSSLDVWSMGCVAAEMIACTKAYRDSGVSVDNRFLFTGSACYPLSPDHDQGAEKGEDQLQSIIETIGGIEATDLAFITEDNTVNYVCDFVNEAMPKIDFKKEFDLSEPEIPAILDEMLQINPAFRNSPQKLLSLPVFDCVRQPSLERDAPSKVDLWFDEKFDYDECLPIDLTCEQLLRHLSLEIEKV